MKATLFVVIALALVALRVGRRARRRTAGRRRSAVRSSGPFNSGVGLIAAREVRERVRGRVFQIGTVVILLVVGGAIVIPVLQRSKAQPERVGVVGTLSAPLRAAVLATGASAGTTVELVAEADRAAAVHDLRSGRVDLAVVDGRSLVVDKAIGATDVSTTAQLARAVAKELGVAEALAAADLSPRQSAQLAHATALPVTSLQPGKKRGTAQTTSLIGVILVFVMLTQYNTWILMGVMEEKASRVVEVLLAAVRPVQLLAGKVIGIGLVAFGQAGLVVAFALVLAEAVGSTLLHGTAPIVLASTLVWLVLGYAFYCWVYAAAGSTVARQDQVQSLAFPLSLPIIFGYIFALTTLGSGSPSLFFKVLAYLPPTAPFAMPVLVAFGTVSWWEFAASAALCIICTFGVARLAAGIYRRSILRIGRRVKLRDLRSGVAG